MKDRILKLIKDYRDQAAMFDYLSVDYKDLPPYPERTFFGNIKTKHWDLELYAGDVARTRLLMDLDEIMEQIKKLPVEPISETS